MEISAWLDWLPLWMMFAVTLGLCMAAVEAGSVLATAVILRRNGREPEGPLASMVGAVLGLLAFFLAFTFGMTAARFDARKQLVLDEANAIGTNYLRADMMPPRQGAETRRLLRDYATSRVNIKPENIQAQLRQAEQIQQQLWAVATSLLQENMDDDVRSMYIDSLNSMIDLHQSRKTTGMQYRIPGSIWGVVFVLSFLSMLALGYQVGMAGTRRMRGTTVLAAAFSLVITIIADIDRPGEGLLRVSQQPIADTLQMMQHVPPSP